MNLMKIKLYIRIGNYFLTLGHEWNGPAHCQVETMSWNLPITVLPTNPKQVANVVNLQTEYSMII